MSVSGTPAGPTPTVASPSPPALHRQPGCRATAVVGLTAVVLLVAILPAVVVAPHDPPPSPTVGSVLAGTSSPANNSDLNNTSSRLGEAIGALVDWFVDGLEKVVALVILLLLVGGVVNYVVVGRHRGVWTPAEAVRTGSPPAPSGPPATNGPPAGPERPP